MPRRFDPLPLAVKKHIDEVCLRFETAWQQAPHEGLVVGVALFIPQVAACQIGFAFGQCNQPAKTAGVANLHDTCRPLGDRSSTGAQLAKASSNQRNSRIMAPCEAQDFGCHMRRFCCQRPPTIQARPESRLDLGDRVASGQHL